MSTDIYDVTFADGYVTPGRRKNNWSASTAPTSTDDASDQYEVGSVWVDTTADTAYICVDSTTSAAVWDELGGSGASDHGALTGLDEGDHDTLHTDLTVTGSHDIDRADGATHDLTLTGNATFTLSGAFTGKSTDLRIVLRQDGTGSRTVTWPTISWVGGTPVLQTAANAVDTIGLLSVDDGVTWFGFHAGSGTAASTVEDETTFGITPAVGTDTEYARQDHTHGTPDLATVKALGRWEPVQWDDGSSPWPFVYHDDEIVVAFVEV